MNRSKNVNPKPSAFHEFLIARVLRLMDKISGRDVPGSKKKKPAPRRAA
jgi:hypothetical protein